MSAANSLLRQPISSYVNLASLLLRSKLLETSSCRWYRNLLITKLAWSDEGSVTCAFFLQSVFSNLLVSSSQFCLLGAGYPSQLCGCPTPQIWVIRPLTHFQTTIKSDVTEQRNTLHKKWPKTLKWSWVAFYWYNNEQGDSIRWRDCWR